MGKKGTTSKPVPSPDDGPRTRVWGAKAIGQLAKSKSWAHWIVHNLSWLLAVLLAIIALPIPAFEEFLTGFAGRLLRSALVLVSALLAWVGLAYRDYLEFEAKLRDIVYADGYEVALTKWQNTSVNTSGASKQVWRQLEFLLDEMRKFVADGTIIVIPAASSAETAIKTCLEALRAAVAGQFDLPLEDVNVNLMLPHRDQGGRYLRLNMVQITVESNGRAPGKGSGYTVVNSNPAPGAPTAYVSRDPQYIPDVHKLKHPNFDRKDYRTVMSWPVMSGDDNRVLGIVNIDSPRVAAFGPLEESDKRTMCFTLCGVILRQVALALLDRSAFNDRCNRGYLEEVA